MQHPAIRYAEKSWRMRFGSTPLWQRSFFRHLAVVAGGNVIAQLIGMAFSPIITRLYGPEAFGALGVFTSVVSFGVTAATLAYAYAIVLPEHDADALRMLRLSLMIAGVFALITTVVLVPFRQPIAMRLGAESAAPYLLLAPIAIFCGAMGTAMDQWLVRKKQFRASSGTSVAEKLLVNGTKVGAGLIAPGASSLLGIAAAGRGLHALLVTLTSRATRRSVAQEGLVGARLLDGRSKALLHEYRDFPIYRLPQMLMNSAAHSLPLVLLALYFDPAATGFYVLADRMLRLPGTIVGVAVRKVFQQRIAEAAHQGASLRPLIVRATLGLAAAGIGPFAFLMALGPVLFSFVFGPEWKVAGEYARWLGVWLFFGFINGPSVSSIPVLALQSQFLAYEVVTVIVRAASLVVGVILLKNEISAIALFSITGAVINAVLIMYVIYQSGTRLREVNISQSVEPCQRIQDA